MLLSDMKMLPMLRVMLSPKWLALCLALLALPASGGGETELGRQAFDIGDYQKAEALWLPQAREGDAQAQFLLGVLYDQGAGGIARDNQLASRWFKAAAEQGHTTAQFNLGNAYKHGRGVEKDTGQAIYWWQQAADKGMPNAQFNLAIEYFLGKQIPQDTDKAVELFNLAAENGHPRARKLIAEGKIPALNAPDGNDSVDSPAADDGSSTVMTAKDTANPEPPAVAAPVEAEPNGTPVADKRDDNSWLADQPPTHFTIQLAASRTGDGFARFIERHGLTGRVRQVTLRQSSGAMHYLLMGSFPDRAEASRIIGEMPAALRAVKPWPKPFSQLTP